MRFGKAASWKARAGQLEQQWGNCRATGYVGLSHRERRGEIEPRELINAAHATCFSMALSKHPGESRFAARLSRGERDLHSEP